MKRVLTLAAVVLLSAALVPLALPEHEGGVPRATASDKSDLAGWAAPQLASGAGNTSRATVTLLRTNGGIPVPRSYLGISTEYSTLPLYARNLAAFVRVLALVHASGDGPVVIRVGGVSADHAFWEPRARRTPRWALRLSPDWLSGARAVVVRGRVRLILDLNLVTGSPGAAASWARAAQSGLPRGSIVGFEIGNESDVYNRLDWLARLSKSKLAERILPAQISGPVYAHDFDLYATALARVAPRIPLIGPALAEPLTNIGWLRTLVAQERSRVGMLSAHRYPLSACARPGSRLYPTIGRLLSERISAGVARSLRPVLRLAHDAGRRLLLTEVNSVTCGGVRRISDSFATGLWAPDFLFETLRAGVSGVYMHVRDSPVNAAFVFNSRGLVARPLLYGMIMFARTLGPDAHLLPAHVGAGAPGLKVWVVRVRGGILHLLLIDKGGRGVRVLLRLPASGPATVERLLAPSPVARWRVVLGGQWLGREGRWIGTRYTESIGPGPRGYVVVVPRHSAALLRVRLHPEPARHRIAARRTARHQAPPSRRHASPRRHGRP
jgi:hypothetical protein